MTRIFLSLFLFCLSLRPVLAQDTPEFEFVEQDGQIVALQFEGLPDLDVQSEVNKLQELYSQPESEERDQKIKALENELQLKIKFHILPRSDQILQMAGVPVWVSGFFAGLGTGVLTYHFFKSAPYAMIAGITSALVVTQIGDWMIKRGNAGDQNAHENAETICRFVLGRLPNKSPS